jgi:hypothetical protein
MGFPSMQTVFQGWVSPPRFEMRARGPFGRNSWRWLFEGQVNISQPGSWLVGTVGPTGSVAVFSAIWLSFVSLFFILGAAGLVTNLVTHHGAGLLPFVLIPGAMLIAFLAITNLGWRISRSEWRSLEQWLWELLEIPPPPVGQRPTGFR